ncbi:MAG: DNA polymerase III subunit epsilon, partial [Gammaproteobacteria bacterium]|nr:DNA polymerase III subunit epsilon [Gammaproteobacteria bacterium]
MRQIVIDTETTGLEPEKGHRIIEIGCVELVDRQQTGNKFHRYINPKREVETEALAIHGITNDFLADKPSFADILVEFLDFINGAELIAHNAKFDIGFINHEIRLIAKDKPLLNSYVTVFDTLALARKKFPGQRNSLDAVCKRYQIDLSGRNLHGALLDAQLLAEAYLLMTGGQGSLFADQDLTSFDETSKEVASKATRINKSATLIITANDDELAAHDSLLTSIKKSSNKCLWSSK